MPPPKKRIKSTQRVASDESEIDSEGEAERAEAAKPGSAFKEKDGKTGWELGKRRRVTISDFKGRRFVDIREYYEKDGKLLPGKKGISLTLEQYQLVTSLKDEIVKAMES